MKLIKSCKLWSLVLALIIVFAMGVVAFADDLEIDVYLTVERTLLGGQALILEPTKVTVPAGSDVLEVLQAAKNQDLLDFTYIVAGVGEYVRGFEVTSHGEFDPFTDYAYYDEFDAAAGGMGYIYFEYGTTPQDLFLTEGNYCMLGGWIVSLNDEITWDDDSTPENEAMPTMTTIVEDNDVLRFQYSLALARDAGFEGWSLLTLEDLEPPFYERANKSELVRRMADHGTSNPAYAGAMSVLMDMEATPAEVLAMQEEIDSSQGELHGSLEYLTSAQPSEAVTARVTLYGGDENASADYFVEAYCSWDEETWYYKGASEVTIPEGETSSYVDLEYSIYQTGNLHSKVVIYNDGGNRQLGTFIKSDTDYVAVWYHFSIENSDVTIEQYVSSAENINDPIYLISKQSNEDLWKQYVLEEDTWTDTGITYEVEPFTENWVLNGSRTTLESSDFIQSTNTSGLLNLLHITKSSIQVASEIIQNNAEYILESSAVYSVDPKITAGVIYTEQSFNVNIFDIADGILAFYGILDTSVGVGQVKMSTAKILEDEGYVSKASVSEGGWNIPVIGFVHGTETMAREKRLENNQQNTIYVAAYLKYWQDMWEDEYPQISEDPAILGTLYNLGTRANPPNSNPQSNPFGDYVEENYDYMGDLLGLTEF